MAQIPTTRSPDKPPCYDVPYSMEGSFIWPLLIAGGIYLFGWIFNIQMPSTVQWLPLFGLGVLFATGFEKAKGFYIISAVILFGASLILFNYNSFEAANFFQMLDGFKALFLLFLSLFPPYMLGGSAGRFSRELHNKIFPKKVCLLPT